MLVKSAAKSQIHRQTLVDSRDFLTWEFTIHSTDAPLIDRSQVIDQRKGLLRQAARTRRQSRIENPFAACPRYRNDAQERKTLVAGNFGIAYHYAGPNALLFVSGRGIELH